MKTTATLIAIVASLAAPISSAQSENGAEFIALGSLPGGASGSFPFAVSADGEVVAGWAWSAFGREAWVWTRATGMIALGDLPGGDFESKAFGISDDGIVVVGTSISGTTPDGNKRFEAFRWTTEHGMQSLGLLGELCQMLGYCFASARANAVSGSGEVIVGESTTATNAAQEAMIWTEAGGMEPLPGLPQPNTSRIYAISDDGNTAVGNLSADLDGDGTYEGGGIVWNAVPEIQFLPDFFGEPMGGATIDLSSDGSIVAGHARSPRAGFVYGDEAFRWTAAGGLEALGFLDESELSVGSPSSWTEGISGDGSIVVGNATVNAEGLFNRQQAFIWDELHGMRNLRDVFVNEYGFDLTGWGTLRAEAISANGRAVVGFGENPPGSSQAWLAILPPSGPAAVPLLGPVGLGTTALLCGFAALVALSRRGRERRSWLRDCLAPMPGR